MLQRGNLHVCIPTEDRGNEGIEDNNFHGIIFHDLRLKGKKGVKIHADRAAVLGGFWLCSLPSADSRIISMSS